VVSQIVAREAGKLLELSNRCETPLPDDSLQALETLARCVKHLKAQADAPPSPPADEMTDEEALALVKLK